MSLSFRKIERFILHFFKTSKLPVPASFFALSKFKTVRKKSAGFIFLLLFLLPTQLGKHFWPEFSFVQGLRIDYLSPTLYVTDMLVGILFVLKFDELIRFIRAKLQDTNY